METNSQLLKPGQKPLWVPQAGSQTLFLRSTPVFEVLYEGTRGPGKTDALLMDFHNDCGKGHGANWKGILFRQTYPQLQDVITKSKKWFNQLAPAERPVYNASEHFWRWPDGEMLLLRQFNKVDDYWNYHGHEYPWIGWEELCNWATDEGYKRMMSCCRSSTRGVPKRVRSTTNPYGPGHNWVKFRWRLPESRGRIIKDSYDEDGKLEPPRMAIHGYLQENKILLTNDPGYIDRIRASARNEAERAAWLLGSWDIVAGGMFDDMWKPPIHVLKPFSIPRSWRLDRSFDWGSSKPFSVGWWAESDGTDVTLADGRVMSTVKGDLFRIAEWYGSTGKPNEGLKMLATDVTKGIIERELKWGYRRGDRSLVNPGVADSAIYNVEDGKSIAGNMAKKVRLEDGREYKGVAWLKADKRPGSRKTGWEEMRIRLANSIPPRMKDREGNWVNLPREEPGLFIFETCRHWLRTVPVLPRDEKDQDDVDTDAEDHAADETRYRVRAATKRTGTGKTTGNW